MSGLVKGNLKVMPSSTMGNFGYRFPMKLMTLGGMNKMTESVYNSLLKTNPEVAEKMLTAWNDALAWIEEQDKLMEGNK